jgi:hypothetical protein
MGKKANAKLVNRGVASDENLEQIRSRR